MAGSKKKNICSDCGVETGSLNAAKVHYFSKHYWDKKRDAHTCSKCNETFASLMAHRFHYMHNHFTMPDGEVAESMKMPYPEYAKVQQQMSAMQKEMEELRQKFKTRDTVVLPDGEEIVVEQEEKPWEKLYLEDAFLSILEKCNLRCTHCYLRDYVKVTDASDWMTMMDTLKGVGIKKVVLFGGEPTMHPNFFDIVHYASSSFKHVSIQSNGINKSALAKAAAFRNVNAVISFEDWEPNKHNAVRARVPIDGSGKREGKKIDKFDAYGIAYDTLKSIPNSTLRGTIYSNNDVLKMAVMAEMAQANSMFFPFIPTQGAAGIQNLAPNGRKLLQDYKNLFMFDEQSVMLHRCEFPTYYMFRMVQWKGRIDAGTASDEEINRYHSWKTAFAKRGRICGAGNHRLYVDGEGEVYPCHFLWEEKFKCGNLLKNDIGDILGNLKAFSKKIYNLERGGNCSSCNVNGLCGGGGACQYIHKGIRTGDTCPIAQGRNDSNEIKPAYLQKPLLTIRRI